MLLPQEKERKNTNIKKGRKGKDEIIKTKTPNHQTKNRKFKYRGSNGIQNPKGEKKFAVKSETCKFYLQGMGKRVQTAGLFT